MIIILKKINFQVFADDVMVQILSFNFFSTLEFQKIL